METKIYNTEGKEAGSVTLPEKIFGLSWNADLVYQVMTSLRSSERTPVAHTKDRSEVRGGGKKPWQQKGLGRARHGSSRSPIWVGGGVAHGPRNEKNYDRKINKKAKVKALFVILSQKMRDGEVLFVDAISMKAPKTKDALKSLNSLATIKGFEKIKTKRTNAALIALPGKDVVVEKSFRNLGKTEVSDLRNVNPLHLLNHKFVIFVNPALSLKVLEAKLK
jgi:large subunit ribosomal protein L4